MNKRKIAIIGSGIAGLTCGYYLSGNHEVTLYESEGRLGGHTHTVAVDWEGEQSKIDTGFIVFNDRTYPNFIELMESNHVPYQPTEMSFSVRNDAIDLEYSGHNLNTLFAQRSNIWRPKFWKMLRDIVRFNADVRDSAEGAPNLTVGEYLNGKGYSAMFKDNYVLPMISAIWSMGLEQALALPLLFFARFFDNHGLLNITQRPQWYTIIGGSDEYIGPLTQSYQKSIRLNTPVTRVERKETFVRVHTAHDEQLYDDVILACHGDQALKLLVSPTNHEKRVLGNFQFSDNSVVLHTGTSHLPRRRNAWASWNYHVVDVATEQSVLSYNMNMLQRIKKKNTYLVTLNQDIDPHYVIQQFNYQHPIFTAATLQSQQQWESISGSDRIHYCGAYWFNGFHEDGVRSALRVCRMLEGRS